MRRLITAVVLALTIAANLGVPPAAQARPVYEEKWIEVILSKQLLLAHEGERVV
jgi:hypothetical protein